MLAALVPPFAFSQSVWGDDGPGSTGGAAVSASANSVSVSGRARLIIYADSRWDNLSDRFDCDFCNDAEWPSRFTVERNFARASSFLSGHSSGCITNSGGPNYDPTGSTCTTFLDRSLYQTSGPRSGACGIQPTTAWPGITSTCLADQVFVGSYATKDVVWIDYGINDAREEGDADDAGWQTRLSSMETALDALLDANDAFGDPKACVLAVTAPTLTNDQSGDPSMSTINRRIDVDLRSMIVTQAAAHGCEVADLYGAVMSLPSEAQRAAAFFNCAPSDIGTDQGAGGNDCVHYAQTGSGNDPIIAEVIRAIDAVQQ